MTLEERLQHGALALSFILLVITGFMLRFPDSWWVVSIRSLSSRAFDLRSLLHRVAAVVMCLASVYHLYYVIFTVRGRQLVKDLWIRLQDARDVVDMLKYNLGISPIKPRLDRFSYIEKAEYWALIWGTIVMAATGFAMWLDNSFLNLFGKLGYDVARTIHYYEAILATLAIIVWHFYFVIFNPDSYPMNTAWYDGMLSEKEMEEEHPLELERIHAAEEKARAEAEKAAEEKYEGLIRAEVATRRARSSRTGPFSSPPGRSSHQRVEASLERRPGRPRRTPIHLTVPHESRAGGVSHGGSCAPATRIGPTARAAGASANSSLCSSNTCARLIRRPARGAVRGPACARTPLAGHPSRPLRSP